MSNFILFAHTVALTRYLDFLNPENRVPGFAYTPRFEEATWNHIVSQWALSGGSSEGAPRNKVYQREVRRFLKFCTKRFQEHLSLTAPTVGLNSPHEDTRAV